MAALFASARKHGRMFLFVAVARLPFCKHLELEHAHERAVKDRHASHLAREPLYLFSSDSKLCRNLVVNTYMHEDTVYYAVVYYE